MEKVKITQEQADAIERWVDKDQLLIARATGLLNHGEDESIAELEINTLAKAIYIGYEVEPEFKVGEWVVLEDGYIGEIEFINEVEGWANIGYSKDTKERGVCLAATYDLIDIVRHATPSEIVEEKERRWWRKNGRDVWELREDDILDYLGDLLIVDSFDSEEVYFKSNKYDSSTNKYSETPSYVQENFKVVTFAENRLDVKTNE